MICSYGTNIAGPIASQEEGAASNFIRFNKQPVKRTNPLILSKEWPTKIEVTYDNVKFNAANASPMRGRKRNV